MKPSRTVKSVSLSPWMEVEEGMLFSHPHGITAAATLRHRLRRFRRRRVRRRRFAADSIYLTRRIVLSCVLRR